MTGKGKAAHLTVKAAAVGRGKALELIRGGASNKALREVVNDAYTQAAKNAVSGATKRGGTYFVSRRQDRKHRLLAMDLARQIGGEVSVRTVIAGERYYVVWRGDQPVDSFPMLPKDAGSLAERPELSAFVGRRVAPPPN